MSLNSDFPKKKKMKRRILVLFLIILIISVPVCSYMSSSNFIVSLYAFVEHLIEKKDLTSFLDYWTVPPNSTIKSYVDDSEVEIIEVNKNKSYFIWESLTNNIKSGTQKYYNKDTFEFAFDYEIIMENTEKLCDIRFLNHEQKGVIMFRCWPENIDGTIILNKENATNFNNAISTVRL